MAPDDAGGGARRIDQDAVERPAIPEAGRLARIADGDTRGALQPPQRVLDERGALCIDVERGDFAAAAEELEQVPGLAARGRAGIQDAHASVHIEQPGGQLRARILYRDQTVREPRQVTHAYRVSQSQPRGLPLYRLRS